MKKTGFVLFAAICTFFGAFAAESPRDVGKRLAERCLARDPESFYEKGIVHYAVVNTWVAALEYAHLAGDAELQRKLVAKFAPYLPGGARAAHRSRARHVDHAVFGALPLEIAFLTGDRELRAMGLRYADDQWAAPQAGDIDDFPDFIKSHFVPIARQHELYRAGYTGQTRLWIDDMYMINALQTQAFRVTGNVRYLDRAAHEMVYYLDKLQLPNGLFDHAEGIPYRWGRGNGWMAAGMPLVLRYLDASHPDRQRILAGYRKMMAALLKWQRSDGLWSQLVDDPGTWAETSGSAMFAFAFFEGLRHGWLDAAVYREPAQKAYAALVARLDDKADLADVCVGTCAKDDRAWYLGRGKVAGDPHGQAPLLWIVNSMLEAEAEARIKTPETSALFEKRVDPVSGVESWLMKDDVLGQWHHQGLYYTTKSMTDDGRFLLFGVAEDERTCENPTNIFRTLAFVDFAAEKAYLLPDVGGIPFFDTRTAQLYYAPRVPGKEDVQPRLCRRDFLVDPFRVIDLCAIPPEASEGGREVNWWYTHLSLSQDRTKAFLDFTADRKQLRKSGENYRTDNGPSMAINFCRQGTVDLNTGVWKKWTQTKYLCNHGLINPVDDTVAFCAHEMCWEGLKPGDIYDRIHLHRIDGSNTRIRPMNCNYATHESWAQDGSGLVFCPNGAAIYDLKSGREEMLCPIYGIHADLSRCKRYVAFDSECDTWWRGCPWKVSFWNRDTGRKVDVYSRGAEIFPKPEKPGDRSCRLHPDAHPAFVKRDAYILSTFNKPGRMCLSLTPVAQLVARTAGAGNEREVWDLSETTVRIDRFEGDHNSAANKRAAAKLKAFLTARSGRAPAGSGRYFNIGNPPPDGRVAAPGEGIVQIRGGKAFLWGDVEKAVEVLIAHIPEGVRVTLRDGSEWSSRH